MQIKPGQRAHGGMDARSVFLISLRNAQADIQDSSSDIKQEYDLKYMKKKDANDIAPPQ